MTTAEQQAQVDFWAGESLEDAYREGVEDRARWLADPLGWHKETPPVGTKQWGEYMRGWMLKPSLLTNLKASAILDEVMANV